MKRLDSDRWVRAYLGDSVVLDSRHPVLVFETGFPVGFYGVPAAAFTQGVLRESSEPPARAGFDFHAPKGAVTTWYDIAVGERVVPHAAWTLAEAPDLVIASWDPQLLDRWMEEDVVVQAHPRDPFHRVDALRSSRRVTVSIGGEVVADSREPVLLFETNLPTRYYLPPSDVALDKLAAAEGRSVCAYKGTADRYWDSLVDPELRGVAWSYSDPDPSVSAIAGRIAFYDELVDVAVDGIPQLRPESPFSRKDQRPV
jgi:uncharacterized protein (DUF427 family)